MANDLRIRQLGRPKIEEDSALGFQIVSRKYAVEGPKASKVGIEGTQDGVALFREFGEPDEEFSDHYLINQQVTPGATVDSATLVRQYAQLRNTWYGQQTSESGQLKKLTRKYVVLKNSNSVLGQLGTPSLGYEAVPWSRHPVTGQNSPDEADNWDLLPKIVKDTEPKNTSYQDGDEVGVIPPSNKLSSENENTRVVFPRVVKVLSNTSGEVELEVTGAAPWKLGEQCFEATEGKALIDAKQEFEEGQEFIILTDPRTGTSVDDPTTYDPSDPYTEGVGTLDIGLTVTLSDSVIKPVKPNIPSVFSQTDDAKIIYSLADATRETNFIEDLAVLENRIPSEDEAVNSTVGNLIWVRASCSVDTSKPGVDMWDVSWVAPVSSYWRIGGQKETQINQPTIVAFDHLGLKTFKTTSSRVGGSAVFTYFTVQEQVPITSASYTKNSGSVSMDVKIIGTDGSKATASFKQSFKNAAMYKTVSGGGGSGGSTGVRMAWPTEAHIMGLAPFGPYVKYKEVACYGNACANKEWLDEPHSDMTERSWKFHWQAPDDLLPLNHPCFQGEPIQVAAGHITWDSTIWNISITGTPSSFKVTPIFFHNTLKIWKVEVTYM